MRFKIAADIQKWSNIQIYMDMYVISDILKTSTQNGKEVVTHACYVYDVSKAGGVIYSFTH